MAVIAIVFLILRVLLIVAHEDPQNRKYVVDPFLRQRMDLAIHTLMTAAGMRIRSMGLIVCVIIHVASI